MPRAASEDYEDLLDATMEEADPDHALRLRPISEESLASCWLCKYCQTPEAKFIHTYMVTHAGSMAPTVMAKEMAALIAKDFPDSEGADTSSCLTHLKSHCLHPVVRMSIILRSLIRLGDDVQHTLTTYNEEGHPTIDPKSIEAYLKIQNQTMLIYKMVDSSKLMFGDKAA